MSVTSIDNIVIATRYEHQQSMQTVQMSLLVYTSSEVGSKGQAQVVVRSEELRSYSAIKVKLSVGDYFKNCENFCIFPFLEVRNSACVCMCKLTCVSELFFSDRARTSATRLANTSNNQFLQLHLQRNKINDVILYFH